MSREIAPGAKVRQIAVMGTGAPPWRVGAVGEVIRVNAKSITVRWLKSKIVKREHECLVPREALALVPAGSGVGRRRTPRGGWADVLYEVRTGRTWSYREVGRALGLGATQVREIERGAQDPSPPVRRLLLLLRSVDYRRALGRNEGAFELAAAADARVA